MAVTLNANSSTGFIATSDTSGVLQLQTGGTTALTVDASQNVTLANGSTIQGLTVGRGAGAGSTNTAVGASALASNSGDTSCTAFGFYALNANTSGSYNVALGRNTLIANTSGSNNVAIGLQALNANTTASNNTAVGYQALYSNVTGTQNIAIGPSALYSNTGDYNNALGRTALNANTSGTSNNAFGNAALEANTTGSYNTAFGNSALAKNTTASNNTAFGYQAGFTNITGTGSNYFGRQAGYSSNANYNTMMGDQAGYVSTGIGNTFFGYYAGGGATSATYNTFVGYGAGNTITTGGKNSILGCYNGNQGGLDIRTASNYIVLSDGDGNPRCIFDGSGNLLVGVTGVSATNAKSWFFDIGQGYQSVNHSTANTSGNFFSGFAYNGSYIGSITQNGTTAVAYNTTSDYRLKENIQPISGALARVAALNPCTYTWKSAPDEIGEGFIAHELAEVCPQAVTGEKDAVNQDGSIKPQSIDTSFLVATLTAAIQEQQAIITQLQADVAALKGTA